MTVGPDDRLPLVLLPGMDGTGRLFSGFVAELAAWIRPVVIPLPAIAVGTRPERVLAPPTALLDALAAHVRERLPAGGRFAVLGESFSGPIALRLAAVRPPGLAAVVLVASFHRRPVARWRSLAAALVPVLPVPPPRWAIRRLLAGPDASPALVREVRDAVASVPPAEIAARVRAALAEDASAALAACAVPVLSLHGARDRLLRRALPEELRALRPALQIERLAAPHLVLQRAPRDAARAVERFLTAATAQPPAC